MSELREIPLSLIDDHPDNPRIRRDDIVDMIAGALNGSFPKEHAIKVRPQGERYQTISGHHRRWASAKKGYKTIWAWVSDADDDTAYMELVTSNSQGEMDAIEYARHIFRLPKAQGTKGKGLSAYSKTIGKSASWAKELATVGEVLSILDFDSQLSKLRGKAEHIKAVHSADRELWPVLCDLVVKKDWTAKDTKDAVESVKDFFIPPPKWQSIFLPYWNVIERFLLTREFSSSTVARLADQAESTSAMIMTAEVDREWLATDYHKWLADNMGGDSWDLRKLKEKHREIESEIESSKSPVSDWHLGNWRAHIKSLEDGSVSALISDPPYGIDFQSDHRLDRTKPRKHERIANDSPMDAMGELSQCLEAFWPKLCDTASIYIFCHWSNEHEVRQVIEDAGFKIRNSIIWVKNNTGMGDPNTTYAPKHERVIYAVKGSPVLFSRLPDVLEADRCNSDRHPTEKPVALLSKFIEVSTVKGELVADPFGGVASTLATAKQLGRNYWGCELENGYHEIGKGRLLNGEPSV